MSQRLRPHGSGPMAQGTGTEPTAPVPHRPVEPAVEMCQSVPRLAGPGLIAGTQNMSYPIKRLLLATSLLACHTACNVAHGGHDGGQSNARIADDKRKEIIQVGHKLERRFAQLQFSFVQEYAGSRGVSRKGKVNVAPDRLLAESDEWVFCLTKTRAFALQ